MASGGQTVLQFSQASTNLTAKILPLVIFNICDCFVRRPDQTERVIVTLPGSVLPDGTVDIRNAYAVPHNESSDQDSPMQGLQLKHLSLGNQQIAAQFQEIPLDMCMVEAERVGCRYDVVSKSTELDSMIHLEIYAVFVNGIRSLMNLKYSLSFLWVVAYHTDADVVLIFLRHQWLTNSLVMEGMEATMERLLTLIDDVHKYFGDVVDGRVAPDNNIGRFISDTVYSMPKLSSQAFDKLVNDSLQVTKLFSLSLHFFFFFFKLNEVIWLRHFALSSGNYLIYVLP
ncbi:hypothetical protein ACH5RR_016784 [Cinchona calisaya]|uniref:Uncharacterized protein n=1 Tax=Cinchona calisaya TaxID=153742 RepID=A0ABD3A0C4_9GENT